MSGIIDGGRLAFRAMAFGRPSQQKIEFLQRQFDDPSRALNFANRSFFERSRQLFENNFSEDVMYQYDRVLESHNRTWDEDSIRPLRTLEDFQFAKPQMQRWMMANPRLRQLQRQGRIGGWAGSYFDHSPKIDPRKHHDYRKVMSGLEQEDENGETVFITYMDEELPGDSPLYFTDKKIIRSAWEEMEHLLDTQRKDPTDTEGSDWG